MRLLKRGPLVDLDVEPFTGVDGQGAPSYSASSTIQARTVDEDAVVRTGDGSEVRTTLTAWVDGSESPLPGHRDRITDADGTAYIVVEQLAPRQLISGDVDHVRLRCREE